MTIGYIIYYISAKRIAKTKTRQGCIRLVLAAVEHIIPHKYAIVKHFRRSCILIKLALRPIAINSDDWLDFDS